MPTEAPTWDQTRALDTEPTWDSTQPTWENTREASPVESPRAARKADLQAQQAQAREEGVTTSIPTRLAAGIEQGMNTPERMIRGGLDALQYYRTLDAASQLAGGKGGFEQQNLAWLKAFNDRDAQLARETAAIEGRDRNFTGDLVQGIARGVVELPPQLLAGAAGAARGMATAASAGFGGLQGGLTQFSQDRGEGMAQAEALPYAAANAGITFLTTAAFGNSGVESIFRKEGVQGFRRRLVGALKDAGMEGAEEMVDQVQQDLLERAARNPGKSLDATLYDVLQAGAVGTAIGGVASAPRLLNRQSAIGNRQSSDGTAYVVNSETGTTELGPVDELPAPREDSGEKIENRPAQAAPSTLSPLSSTLSPTSPATPPTTAAPAAPADLGAGAASPRTATPGPETIAPAAGLSVEPIEFSPFDTAGRDPAARSRVREDSRSEWQDPLVPPLEPATGTAFDPSQVRTVEFPLAKLKLSKDVPNFKGGASEETGTVAGQELAGKYQRTGTAPIVAWQRLNGDTEVITGRHRFDLARRTGETTIPTQLVREADGFTKDMALTFDAEANIRDGQGEVADYATYFKGTSIPEAEARARGLLSRAKGKAGWSLAKAATDDVYALWRADKLTDAQAVAIANAAPGDAGAQQIGSKFALQGKGADFIANVIKASQAEAGQRAESLDLFGADDSAMKAMAEQAERASQFQRDLVEQIRAVQGAAKRPEVARKLGVDVKDPEGIVKRIGELKAELAQWENWPMQPELVAKVRGEATKPAFSLAPAESVEQQKARLAQEQAQREAKAAKDKLAELQAKPLQGTIGDLGQGDMFTAPDDLFAPPTPGIVQQLDAAIESAKIKPGGLYSLPDLGLTVTLWNGTLHAVQLSLRAGQRLAEAIQSGLDWLRAQGQQFDEAKVRAALEQAILQSPGVREHVGKRLLQEDFSPAAKAAVEKLLLHEVKPDEQLFAEAAAVIEAVGPREALASYFGNPWGLPQDSHVVLGFALGNALSTLETEARAAGDTATANRIGQENAEFQSQFVLQSTETARTLRAYRYFDLVGNLSPFTADVFARKVIEKANAQERNRLKPTLDEVGGQLGNANQEAVNEAAGDKGVQGTARTVINQTIEAEAQQGESAVRKAIVLEVSNTLETLPSVVRKASAAVVQAWRKLGLEEQVRVQTGRAGQALENSLWSAVKQRGGSASTVSSVIAQVNRALHEQVNRALGVTKEQFTNPTTYLMRLRDALGNAEVMSRIWEQTRAAVGANLRAIGEKEGLLLRIEAEIADLEAQAKLPLAGGPEVTATDPKLKAAQQGARDAMLAGRNANIAEAIKLRRERIADVAAQLAEFRKMQPAWEAVLGMTVDVWGPNLLRGVLREQMKADGFRLRKAVADHFRGLAGAPDPLATLGTLTKKIIAASGLDEQAAGRLAKDFEAEYTAQVEKERARLAERLAKTRERQADRAKQRAVDQPRLDAEALIDGYERRQTEWLKPAGRKSAVRAIVRQALRQGAAVSGLDEQAVRGGLQAHLEAVGVPTEAAYRLAYEVWQDRQAAGGGLDAVVAGRVKALQLNLGAIVRQHWSQVGRAGESLAAQIVGETGMPAEQAERLAAAIERRFKALATAKKEALLRNLAKTPAARQLQKKSVSQRIIEFSNLGAFDSEGLWNAVAEKLGLASYSREASAEVKRLAERAQQLPDGSVQRQEATARLMRFIARQHGLKLGDLGWAFWYANTLSGPITHLVNIGSNTLSLAGNVATQFRDARGIPQILAATAMGFRTGGQEARAILKQGPGANRTKFTEQGQALENLDPQDFTGAGLVRKWRVVARALAAADAAFYFPAREAKAITLARALARQEGQTGAAIGQQARDILDGTEQQQNVWGAQVDRERAQLVALGEKPDALWTVRRLEQLREQAWASDIGEAADDFALRTTYNNQPYGLIGALADVAKFAQRKVPGVRLIVPFVNIVANVTNESINYTPWGFARAYAAGQTGVPSVNALWSEKLRNGQTPLTPDAVIDLHTKAALGTALVGGIMAAALAGLDDDDGENFQLYGQGPKDPAARKALRETGWIPYSVRVGGKYISIANTPLAIPLGAMGNYLDAERYDKRFDQANAFNRLGVALWGGAHVITQQSFLDSAARLAGAIENPRGRSDTLGDRGLAEALRSGGNLVVPNALRQLDRMFDPTLYDNRGIEGALVASIPFARRNGSPALNAFGEPITSSPWARFASDAKPNVWADLAHRGVYPSPAEKVKNRWGREMTDDEHYRYVELSGQAIKRRLETPGMRQKIRTGKEDDLRKTLTGIVKDEREKARTKLGF